jgi:hypothetical protein
MTAPDHQVKPPVQSDTIRVRMKPELRGMISHAAEKRSMTDSAWLRNAALTSLMLEGIQTLVTFPEAEDEPAIDPTASRSAGDLYDRVEGRQRFARIEGDQIKGIRHHAAKADDGNVWVPVVHEDSEPFDLATHWRLAPHYALVYVAGVPDHVICTYPVVAQSPEHA